MMNPAALTAGVLQIAAACAVLWAGMQACWAQQGGSPTSAGSAAVSADLTPVAEAASGATADATAPQQLPTVTVQGNYATGIGTSDAASQGRVTSKLIANRPTLRPAELLEFVPGVIVTQHSGDGKANQYFLRGFNLDHGTDFATYVDGMPVNMPTHAHGHGYSDMNWLIPELVSRIDYRKGPYYADAGDFSSAGAAHIRLFDELPRGIASLALGENGYKRALVASSSALGSNGQSGDLLYAIEAAHNDGPWEHPEKFHRVNGVLRYSINESGSRQSLTAMGYSAGWNATDQIPLRAVESGLIGRFGAIDPTDGGHTSRYSLSYRMDKTLADGSFRLDAYAIQSSLELYSNFTFVMDDPVNGDQFEQAERRRVFGVASSRSWNTQLAGRDSTHTIGVQLRHDRLDPVGLYATVARQRIAITQESQVRQTSVGAFAENATQWTPWFRSVAGLRVDHFDFHVQSSIAANSGDRSASIASPKLSLVFGPWAKTEYFVNYGYGFHSNDARGTVATVAAKNPNGPAISPVDPLVRTKGYELGLRTEAVAGLQSSLSLWVLTLDSELLFVGDAGETEATRASRRHGIEWNNHYVANRWLLLDAALAVSKSRFTEPDPGDPLLANHIPGAIETVVSLGATVTDLGPWFGQFQLRYFGPRALDENNAQRSRSTTLAYLRTGYKVNQNVKVMVDVFNLFNREGSDIDYYYASRLPGEPAGGVDDIHFHPVEPRSVRVTLSVNF